MSFFCRISGTTYTRWGHDACPSTATLIYKGAMAGAYFEHKGAGSNHLCMPFDPEYDPDIGNTNAGGSYIYGSEYQSVNPLNPRKDSIEDRNIPCAVCRVQMRATTVMVPAHRTCPVGWTREYYGFLMGAHNSHGKRDYICMDREFKTLPGHAGDQKGNQLYSVGATGGYGLDFPPFLSSKPLTCTVCSE